MAELHIGANGQLCQVISTADSPYARELAEVRLALAEHPQGERLEKLLWEEQNLLLCLASERWYRAMTQLQAEGILSRGPWFRPLALGEPTYYADHTRDNYYKVWWQGERAVAVERLNASFFPSGFDKTGWLTLEAKPGRYALPSLPQLRDPANRLHFVDYYNMLLRVVECPRTMFTFNGSFADYVQVDSNAEGSWRYAGLGVSGPAHTDYVAARPPRLPEFTKCRVCGCTNDDCRQCIEASGQPCSWAAPYLCSRCHAEQQQGGPRPDD